MIINWGTRLEPKYMSFVYGSEWDRCDFQIFEFNKVPLGWSMNIWRLSISYDNYAKVKSTEDKPKRTRKKKTETI